MLQRVWKVMVAVAVVVGGWSSLAPAQSEEPSPAPAPAPAGSISSRSGHFGAGGCLGFTVDPDLFAGQLGAEYYVTDEVAIGPFLQGGSGAGGRFWSLAGMVKYSAALRNTELVRPYGEFGIGFSNLYFDALNHGEHKTTFIFPIGGGAEFELTDQVTLDANVLFDISEDVFVGLYFGGRYLF
jgi:hypothetical protein